MTLIEEQELDEMELEAPPQSSNPIGVNIHLKLIIMYFYSVKTCSQTTLYCIYCCV